MSFDRGLLLTVLRLCYSLRLHPNYDRFQHGLKPSPSSPQSLPPGYAWAIKGALNVLQKAREEEENEDRDEMGDDFRTLVTDRDKNKAGQPLAPMDSMGKALKILVHDAVEEFGFIPRDVCDGILGVHNIKDRHSGAANKLDYDQLQEIVRSFSMDRGLGYEYSHQVVVVFPRPESQIGSDHSGQSTSSRFELRGT